MKFNIVDADAKMLLGHAVELAKDSPESTAWFASARSKQILAALLGLKSISFDINEFGILSARCEDAPVKTVGHYPVELDGSSERAPLKPVADDEFDDAARKSIDAATEQLPKPIPNENLGSIDGY